MKILPFGKTDLRVSSYGIGCARIGGIFQGDPKQLVNLLSAARDAGINFFDTADMYAQGESESLLGRAFRGTRGRVIIASKVGYCLPARRKMIARIKPFVKPLIRLLGLRRDQLPAGARGTVSQDFSPAYLQSAVEASLRRLRTDYLDLLQLHSPPLEAVERGEWEQALEALKRAGKIRYYGVACDTIDVGLAALRFAGVSSVQFTLSLLEERGARELFPLAHARGVAGIARECLANGLLVKEPHQIDLASHCQTEAERELRARQLSEFRERAKTAGRSLTELALAYPPTVEGVSVTLLGVRSIEQLNGLLAKVPRDA